MPAIISEKQREEINRKEYKNIEEARIELFDYIEIFYNRQRLHFALDYKTPVEAATLGVDAVSHLVYRCD